MSERVITLSAINNFFAEDLNCVGRGENALNSGNLIKYSFDDQLKILKGTVKASMKKKNYEVEICLNADYIIESSTCSCPRGQFLCHHMACLCLFAHYNLSKTDVACSWTVQPSQNLEPLPVLPSVHFDPQPKSNMNAVDEFKEKLKAIDHGIGLLWLTSPEPEEKDEKLIPYIEEILTSKDYLSAPNKREYFCNKLHVSPEMIKKVATETIGQIENAAWLISRKHRLTASNFGAIIKAINRNSFPESLFKKLTGFYNLDRVKQIQWGRQKEKTAIMQYEKQEGVIVHPTGLWLHKCGYLGASPDGLINDDGIIEVKCPFSYKDSKLQPVLTDKDVVCWKNDKFVINTEHDYYHQIQGQLFVTDRKFCNLIIFTNIDLIIVKVERSSVWEQNVPLIQDFYFNNYIPYLCK